MYTIYYKASIYNYDIFQDITIDGEIHNISTSYNILSGDSPIPNMEHSLSNGGHGLNDKHSLPNGLKHGHKELMEDECPLIHEELKGNDEELKEDKHSLIHEELKREDHPVSTVLGLDPTHLPNNMRTIVESVYEVVLELANDINLNSIDTTEYFDNVINADHS